METRSLDTNSPGNGLVGDVVYASCDAVRQMQVAFAKVETHDWFCYQLRLLRENYTGEESELTFFRAFLMGIISTFDRENGIGLTWERLPRSWILFLRLQTQRVSSKDAWVYYRQKALVTGACVNCPQCRLGTLYRCNTCVDIFASYFPTDGRRCDVVPAALDPRRWNAWVTWNGLVTLTVLAVASGDAGLILDVDRLHTKWKPCLTQVVV